MVLVAVVRDVNNQQWMKTTVLGVANSITTIFKALARIQLRTRVQTVRTTRVITCQEVRTVLLEV